MKISENMKKIREEIYIQACKDFDSGLTVYEVCKKYDISESAFYAWKKKFNGVSLDKIQFIKSERKNLNKLKKKLKDQEVEIKALRAALKKKC